MGGTAQDITERKEAEEELKIGLKELEEFYQMSVGRELKMVELKKEIRRLKSRLAESESPGPLRNVREFK